MPKKKTVRTSEKLSSRTIADFPDRVLDIGQHYYNQEVRAKVDATDKAMLDNKLTAGIKVGDVGSFIGYDHRMANWHRGGERLAKIRFPTCIAFLRDDEIEWL